MAIFMFLMQQYQIVQHFVIIHNKMEDYYMIKHYLTNKGLLLLWILIFALSYSYSIELDNQKPKEYYKMTTKTIINQNTKQVKIVSINKIHYKYSDAEPVIFISNNKIIPTNEKKPICRITYNSELRFDFNELQIKKMEIFDLWGNFLIRNELPCISFQPPPICSFLFLKVQVGFLTVCL